MGRDLARCWLGWVCASLGAGCTAVSGAEGAGHDPHGKADFDGDGAVLGADCDDEDPTVHPGATELADGVDNDCDGAIDVLFVCGTGGHHTTIGDAIAGAEDGLTLEVCAGTWDEDLDLTGRSLALVAPDGYRNTLIRGTGLGSVVRVHETAPGGVSLDGFTVQGGWSGAGAGGVDCLDADLDFRDGRIRANVSSTGAGLRAESCELSFQGTIVESNFASEHGGGVYLYDVSGTFTQNTVRDSSARLGGGVYLHRTGDLDFTFNNVHDNQATEQGGGLWARSEPVIASNSFVDNIAGTHGGGVYLYKAGPGGEFRDNSLAGNYCGGDGGGLAARHLALDLVDNSFLGNTAADDAGGARVHAATATLSGNVFEANVAGDDGGGSKSCHGWTTWTDNLFEGNHAHDQGGGLESDNEAGDIRGLAFLDNSARHGAGLHTWDNLGPQTVADCTFVGNVADTYGGAIELENNPHATTLRHLHVEGNQGAKGAGIAAWEADVQLENSLVFDNTGLELGGGLYLRHSAGAITNVVFDHNSAPQGSALDLRGAEGLAVRNSVFSWNLGAEAIFAEGGVPGTWSYNDVWMNLGGDHGGSLDDPTGVDGNLAVEPGFMGVSDFTLTTGSPLRDAGDPTLSDPDATRSDIGAFGGPEGAW